MRLKCTGCGKESVGPGLHSSGKVRGWWCVHCLLGAMEKVQMDQSRDELEASREAADRECAEDRRKKLADSGVRVVDEMKRLRGENERLKLGLLRYGHHDETCAEHVCGPDTCDCGLDEAVHGKSKWRSEL